MGKPFRKELQCLRETLTWVDAQDVSALREFLCTDAHMPLYCVGSGGSYSACYYASMLYRQYCGIAMPITPLGIQMGSNCQFRDCKMLYISASGNNKDILQSVKVGLQQSHTKTAGLCMSIHNKMEGLTKASSNHVMCHYEIPTMKDGFLATNSLVGFFGLLLRAYFPSICVIDGYTDIQEETLLPDVGDLSQYDNFIVLYSKYSEAIAYDIESKMSEAGLGAVLLSDYRNFGHGRHNWIDKRGEKTCVVSLKTKADCALVEKTLNFLPNNTSIMSIESELDLRLAPIELLIKSFAFVANVGDAVGIDPGRPGVPEYGSKLYGLNYAFLVKHSLIPLDELAILRKIGKGSREVIDPNLWSYYEENLKAFRHRLKTTKFKMIAFDYDGTLSNSDKDARYKDSLLPEIKEMLLNFLRHDVSVAILSGRGKSLVELFKNEIPTAYWSMVYMGFYNGAYVCRLNEIGDDLITYHKSELCDSLQNLLDELSQKCLFFNNLNIEKRKVQLTIKDSKFTDVLCELCQEIIIQNNLCALHVWKSSHSIDVVDSNFAKKTNIEEFFSESEILYIGDSGDAAGNDFQMLSRPYSLSVDKVSRSADSCWNLIPQGKEGTEATLWYCSKMQIQQGYFNISL